MTTTLRGVLDYFDQTALELLRATGRGQLIQGVWIYDRPVDADGLAGFHTRFSTGLLGRLIERSPLPFGRAHWVSIVGPPSSIVYETSPRPRSGLLAWADEFASRRIDPQRGPGWLLGVLPLTDGSTALTVVASHCLADGGGALLAVWNAATGNQRDLGYPPAKSRTPAQAVLQDLRASARELPRLFSAVKEAGKHAVRSRRKAVPTTPRPATTTTPRPEPAPATVPDDRDDTLVAIPTVVVLMDTDQWDAKAESLGANTYSLVAGFSARLAAHLDRRRQADGTVTLVMARNTREGLDDDRALAMSFASVGIDPTGVTDDLTAARNAIRVARERAQAEPDPSLQLLPIVPWFPRRMAQILIGQMFSYGDTLPVSCSNLGQVASGVANLDGTPADFFFARSFDQSVTLRDLKRSAGTMVVVSGRLNGRIWIAVEAYQLGADNTRVRLRELTEKTLTEFGLAGLVF
jgi:hypothetical protein